MEVLDEVCTLRKTVLYYYRIMIYVHRYINYFIKLQVTKPDAQEASALNKKDNLSVSIMNSHNSHKPQNSVQDILYVLNAHYNMQ